MKHLIRQRLIAGFWLTWLAAAGQGVVQLPTAGQAYVPYSDVAVWLDQMVDRENAGERLNTTGNAVFWSGAYDRPQVGKLSEDDRKKMLAEFAKHRTNNHQSRKIDRLVVASSGDVAYEYGTFNLSFDSVPDKKHVDHDGAYLRTWRKEKGQWLADNAFMQPFGNMSIVAEKK